MSEEEGPKRRVLVTPVEPMDAVEDTKPNPAPKDPVTKPTPKPATEPADEKREPVEPGATHPKNRQR